jgi:hypothetical protein
LELKGQCASPRKYIQQLVLTPRNKGQYTSPRTYNQQSVLALGNQRTMRFTKYIQPTISACTWKSKDSALHQGSDLGVSVDTCKSKDNAIHQGQTSSIS